MICILEKVRIRKKNKKNKNEKESHRGCEIPFLTYKVGLFRRECIRDGALLSLIHFDDIYLMLIDLQYTSLKQMIP